jgi:hypothetical protein
MSTIPDLNGARWVSSTRSGDGGQNCVQWAPDVAAVSGVVPVRDSKDPEGPVLAFPAERWRAFVKHITR